MKRNIIFMTLIILIAGGASLSASEVKFESSLDRSRIALGEQAQLGLTFYQTQSMPAPDLDHTEGLEIRYLGPSTMMTVINGKASSSITHMYSVLPLKIGRFQLGPYSFTFKGDKYASNMVFLEVTEEKTPEPQRVEEPAAQDIDLEDRIFVTLKLDKTRAYVNELIPVTVKLYVNRLNVRDIQLPAFTQEGFSKAEFKEPKQYREESNGLIYDVLEFNTKVFATRSGDYKIGPAKIKCNVLVRARSRSGPSGMDEFFGDHGFQDEFVQDFFSRFERHPLELESEAIALIVSPLPQDNRPADFSGAVGDFQFIFNAGPRKVNPGDPITLTMEINGAGNFNTVLVPKLENVEGFKLYEPQIKTETNTKTFSQVIIPENDRLTQTPGAYFSYFDPNKKEYRTISHNPIPIEIEKGKEEAPPQVVGPIAPVQQRRDEEKLSRDIIYIKESLGKVAPRGYALYRSKIVDALVIIPALLLIALFMSTGRAERLKLDTAYARRLAAFRLAKRASKTLRRSLDTDDSKVFYEKFFKMLQDYLGNRLHVPIAGITYAALEPILKERSVDAGMQGKLRRLFEVCDQAKFASLSISKLNMSDDLKNLIEVIKYFERMKI